MQTYYSHTTGKPLVLSGDLNPTEQEVAEGYVLRTLDVLGTPHHLELIRVEVVDGCQQAWESDTSDPDNSSRYDDIQTHYPGNYHTISLSGVDWVACMFPYDN